MDDESGESMDLSVCVGRVLLCVCACLLTPLTASTLHRRHHDEHFSARKPPPRVQFVVRYRIVLTVPSSVTFGTTPEDAEERAECMCLTCPSVCGCVSGVEWGCVCAG